MAKILILDFSRDLLEVMEIVLKKQNHDVHLLDESDDLFSTIKAIEPDVLIMEFFKIGDHWPNMYKRTQRLFPKLPVIAFGTDPRKQRGLEKLKNIAGVIPKPFDLEEVYRVVANALPELTR